MGRVISETSQHDRAGQDYNHENLLISKHDAQDYIVSILAELEGLANGAGLSELAFMIGVTQHSAKRFE